MFDVTLTKMATFGKNRTMSSAMNNHNLFISGECGTGKHVLLRNKPKVNAFFYSNWPYIGVCNPIDFSNPRASCILSGSSCITIKTIDITAIIVIKLPNRQQPVSGSSS